MGPAVDLLGCEYLGGCPVVGSRVLNKVELHFDGTGLTVAVAPQGLFALAEARPVLVLAWPDISVLRLTQAGAGPSRPNLGQLVRSAVNMLTMRLDLPNRLAVETPAWTMEIGVRTAPADLAHRLNELLSGRDGAIPVVAAF